MSLQIVSVFGAAELEANDPAILASEAVGRGLAQAGYAVMTGGYGGVMAYASKGAREAGGQVIGVTVPYVELVRERVVNPYVTKEVPCMTYRERLNYLVENADAFVVMPGGVGTLQELVEAWQMMRIRQLSPRPLVCYGAFWHSTIDYLLASPYVPDEHRKLIQFAETPEEAVELIQVWDKQYP
jgi:uncharacterized protein (TIGR00730 family)